MFMHHIKLRQFHATVSLRTISISNQIHIDPQTLRIRQRTTFFDKNCTKAAIDMRATR